MMDTMRGCAICVTLVLSLGVAQGQPPPAPTESAFAEQLGRLETKNDKATRLKAVHWINSNSQDKNAALAVPGLERCIRKDPDGEVCGEAVLALCLISKRLEKPCPLVVIEALLDKEDQVRWHGMACMSFFKTFAAGSVEVLLRGVKSEKAEVRSDCLLILGRAARGDKQALEAMENAKRDKVFDVRNSAHLALFHAKDELEEHLPYVIRLREDPASLLSPGPEDSEVGKQERRQRNLLVLGTGIQMIEWSETRADELATVLMKLLADESPVMRRGAASLIGASAVKLELPAKREGAPFDFPGFPKDEWMWSIWPYADPEGYAKLKKETPPKDRPQKSKVAKRLEKLKVEEKLRDLQDRDSDRSVRDAARVALERLAGVSEKQP